MVHTAAVNALQCVEPADNSTMETLECLTLLLQALCNVSNLQTLAQWGLRCASQALRVQILTHLRKLGLCVLDLALKLLQIHRNLDDVLVLHHVPHNAPEQRKHIRNNYK